jgi:hypothetical protein
MSKKIFIIGFLFFLGCNVNNVYNNREQDMRESEEVVKKFYKSIHLNDYNSIYGLLSYQFLENTNTSQFYKLLRASNEKLGAIDSMHLERWETLVIEGSTSKSDYSFIFIAFRKKFPSRETVKLVKENSEVKINSYNVDSEGFTH